MKLTTKGEYAARAVLALSQRYGEGEIPIFELADKERIPIKYLEQILLTLRKAGLLKSKRGVKGGYHLARSPARITLGEVIRVMEGELYPELSGRAGREDPYPALTEVWMGVKGAIAELLDKVTFRQLCDRTKEIDLKRAKSYIYHI